MIFYSSSFLFTLLPVGYRPKKISVISPRGVSRDNKEYVVRCVHGKKKECDVVYDSPLRVVECDNYNKGVMKKHELVYNKHGRPVQRVFMLQYTKPCICGSLVHRNTESSDCLLNTQYLD